MKPRVTLQHIADALGCTKATVSLALRNSPEISKAMRERIQSKAKEMGYKTNPVLSQLMSELRSNQTTKFRAKLALINANEDPNAFKRHPTIPTYIEGCTRRALSLGYSFDPFWLHDKQLSPKRLLQILNTRNIRGIILVGLMGKSQLPDNFTPVWDALPCVVTGVRTRQPTLSFASVDHHDLTLRAMERLYTAGYRRPALVVDKSIDLLVEGRFSAGYHIGQTQLERSNRLEPFLNYKAAKQDPDSFKNWIREQKPDAVLTLYNSIQTWLEEMKLKVPEDIGFAQLELRPGQEDTAGMNQHNDIVGEAAVEMLIGQINANQVGIPKFPRATLISANWQHGSTIQIKDKVVTSG